MALCEEEKERIKHEQKDEDHEGVAPDAADVALTPDPMPIPTCDNEGRPAQEILVRRSSLDLLKYVQLHEFLLRHRQDMALRKVLNKSLTKIKAKSHSNLNAWAHLYDILKQIEQWKTTPRRRPVKRTRPASYTSSVGEKRARVDLR